MTLYDLNRVLLRSYRAHQMVFIVAIAAMLVVDFFWLNGWATFWPMIVWSGLFGCHFMIFKAQTTTDQWVEQRVIFEVYRPWDTGHIEEIKNSPFGSSMYRTELGRVDKNGNPVNGRPSNQQNIVDEES